MDINPQPAGSLSASPGSLVYNQHKLRLDSQIRSGANWFYWIAGLSLVNSVMSFFDAGYSFVVGLGITQVVDAFGYLFAEDIGGDAALIIRLIALGINVVIAALFVLAGFLANKRMLWVFIAGMLLYLVDGVIFMLVQDWFPVIFHLFALFGMFQGLRAVQSLRKLEHEVAPSALSPA